MMTTFEYRASFTQATKVVGELFLQLFELRQFPCQLLFNDFSFKVRSKFLPLVGSCSIDFRKSRNHLNVWQSRMKSIASLHFTSTSNKWKKFASKFVREIVEAELTRKLSQIKQLKEEFTNNLCYLRETCSVFKCGHHQNSSIAAKNTVSRVD